MSIKTPTIFAISLTALALSAVTLSSMNNRAHAEKMPAQKSFVHHAEDGVVRVQFQEGDLKGCLAIPHREISETDDADGKHFYIKCPIGPLISSREVAEAIYKNDPDTSNNGAKN